MARFTAVVRTPAPASRTWDLLTDRRGPRLLARGFTEDSAAALASLDRLAGLATTTLLPGHGEPWRGTMSDAVARARSVGLA